MPATTPSTTRTTKKSEAETNVGTSTIEEAIVAMKAGKFVIVMDNEDRENEGDLIMPAEFATEESLAFMIRHSTGIVCVPALADRLEALQLPLMVDNNTEVHKCKFTVTVDLKEGNSTGVSAADRARTIRAMADPNVPASAFNRPGHIFPLKAMNGGVISRAGHTEAAVDLARMAGCAPVGYICEMNDQNGNMMRRPQLEEFAKEHDLPLITISDMIRYRFTHEKIVECVADAVEMRTPHGKFDHLRFSSVHDGQLFDALVHGNVNQRDVLVHVVEDGLHELVDAQFAQQQIAKHGHGVIVYVNNAKELLDVSGELMARQSIFGMVMQIVKHVGVQSVRILSKEPSSFDLNGFGIPVIGYETLVTA
ncbi:TPA: hypothetical protein N0F65_011387 [Lagenidium giganteum]|uniref:3,4-dihydroxy-2-butanone-4-phosphate synthase n=1 Tax=Lagenidium giganteum TaxID=4803 RepID=A0AAV2Z2P2_9STRA|nr:TPA: hypothetical protein N0F65_011387 [Lagenidium giganteum]